MLDAIVQAEAELPATDAMVVPSRIVHLPLSWDDPATRLAIERYHDVVWHHSHVVIDPDGVVHTFCVYSAPSEERIREHGAAFGGHQIDSISLIAGDVDPDEIAV